MLKTLAIVGGGAAGLTAAVKAGLVAREAGQPLRIDIYERDDRVGRTILATGNGRCNFTNERIDLWRYHNDAFVRDVYAALDKLREHGFYEAIQDAMDACTKRAEELGR